MITKVRKSLEKMQIGSPQGGRDHLLAAVSGGADSVCLLLVLCELQKEKNYDLEVMHVEHGIRGEESLKDAHFVEMLCKELGVLCHVVHVDVPKYSKENGLGTEEAARVLRYEALSDYARKKQAKVVLAHHMEDNAETVLFQLIRGSVLGGMSGIRSVRKDRNGIQYLRPLLDVRRSEIEQYLSNAGQTYCVDSTNHQVEYHRNYVRKEIIPRLTEVNSSAVEHIHKTAQALGEIRDYMDQEAQKAAKRFVKPKGKGLQIDICGLTELHPALQKEVIYQSIATVLGGNKDISSVHVDGMLHLIRGQSGRRIPMPGGLVAEKSFDKVFLSPYEEALENTEKRVQISGKMLMEWKEKGNTVCVQLPKDGEMLECKVFPYHGNDAEIPKKPYTKWFDYDKIKDGFCIRSRENGDFLISDRNGHRKKLKQYFIDEKIPVEQRNSMWILAQDSKVLWVVGGRISEHAKVTHDTKTIIEIHYIGGK